MPIVYLNFCINYIEDVQSDLAFFFVFFKKKLQTYAQKYKTNLF